MNAESVKARLKNFAVSNGITFQEGGFICLSFESVKKKSVKTK